MRAAGVREIKNKLSQYLRLVAEGETVLVPITAASSPSSLRRPCNAPSTLSEDEALRRLAAAGKIRLARGKVPRPGAGAVPGVPRGIDIAAVLAEVRSDRRDE